MRYERRSETVQAQQWKGNLDEMDIAPLRQIEGMTGYQGKLAYYDTPKGTVLTVRPSDYVVKKSDGTVSVMSQPDFDKTYREVANVKKSANNSTQSKKSEDNFIKG